MLFIEINKLKPHPLAASLVPKMTEIEYAAFLDDIKLNGILTPIEIIVDSEKEGEYFIVDGIHRFNAAHDLNIKKLPVTVVELKKVSVEDYIISKTVIRRNISKTQRAALAVEWILRQAEFSKDIDIKDLIVIAGKKFGVSKNIIKIVYDINREIPKVFSFLRDGVITYEQGIKYLTQKNEEEHALIEEFSTLPDSLQQYLRKVPFVVQEEIYQKIKKEFSNTQQIEEENKIDELTDLTEKEHKIKELTDKYFEQKEKEKKIKKELKQAKKYQEKLENLVQSLHTLVKDISDQENQDNNNLLLETSNKAELTDLLNEVNQLKEKLNSDVLNNLDKDNIVKSTEKFSQEDLTKLSQLYNIFLSFTSVFNDYNKGQIVNILREVNNLDKNSYNQILYFLTNLYEFLEVFFKEISEMAIRNKKIDNQDKFLVFS